MIDFPDLVWPVTTQSISFCVGAVPCFRVCSFGEAVAMVLRDLLMASLSDFVVRIIRLEHFAKCSGSGHNNWRNIPISLIFPSLFATGML